MKEIRKTVYLSTIDFDKIMKGRNESFTKRIVDLALMGLCVEGTLFDIEEDLICNDSDQAIPERLKELIDKGHLFEENKEFKVTLEMALGYFNNLYQKKHPNERLPVLK